MSKKSKFSEAAKSFFSALGDAMERIEANAAERQVVRSFEIGDTVFYEGSRTGDHGHWIVDAVDNEANTVTLGKVGSWRLMQVSQRTVRHAAPERATT